LLINTILPELHLVGLLYIIDLWCTETEIYIKKKSILWCTVRKPSNYNECVL